MNSTTVRQVGNSAAVILPKELRLLAGIEIGDRMSVESPEPGTILLRALDEPWSLKTLMKDFKGASPELIDTGTSLGRELW